MILKAKSASELDTYLKMLYKEKIEFKVKLVEINSKIEYRIELYTDESKLDELQKMYHFLNLEFEN